MREKIVPELLERVPKQPMQEELEAHPHLFRFGIVFDREGYSPVFFKQMWEKRIVCYTYQKYAQEDWPESEFEEKEVIFPNGEVAFMKLAERGVYFTRQKMWVRQIHKLTHSVHQTALVTTDYYNEAAQIAGKMFSRWSQENFFKYMMEHYGIDRLIDYQIERMDETIKVVNPRHRELERQIRSKNAKLSRKSRVHTAHLSTRSTRKFRVTHPFHPLFCQEFESTGRKRLNGRNIFVFFDNNGKKTTIPVKWTDAPEEEDAYVVISAGRSYFRVEDLIGLSDLLRSLKNDFLSEFRQ